MAQPLQAAAAGALGKERLGTSVILTAHNHSGTRAGSHLWRWPRTLHVSKAGSATATPPQMKTPQPLWRSVPVLDHLLSRSFPSVCVELPAFQCVPTAFCPVPLGTIENSLAPSLLPHQVVIDMDKMPWSR